MEDIKSKVKIDWGEIERLVEVLSFKIQTNYGEEVTEIYGCPRGGLIPAVMLSHKLGLPLITNESNITEWTLIVDDICDTGETFNTMSNLIPSCYYASLHYREGCPFKCLYAAEVINDWIVYPWEDEKADAIQDYLKK